MPITTERASQRRAPTMVSATAAPVASAALMPIAAKWTTLGISTSLPPKKWMVAPGSTAHAASRPRRETVR